MKKQYVKIVIAIIVFGVLYILWVVSNAIVDTLGNTNDTNSNFETYELESETRRALEFIRDTSETENIILDSESEEYNYQYVKSLFDTDDIDIKVKEFLGDNYDKYSDVLTQITAIGESIINSIPVGSNYTSSDSVIHDVSQEYVLGLKTGSFFDANSFYILDLLTVIDVFGDDIAICAYNYPENLDNELVVVDFSNTKVDTSLTGMFEVGDIVSVKGSKGYYAFRNIDDFYVLFLRAD